MTHYLYDKALECYRRDDCLLALDYLTALSAERTLRDDESALHVLIKGKVAHLATPETYRDKYEWVAQQIPIYHHTWEVFRLRWIITHVRALAPMGYSTVLDIGCQKGEMTTWLGQVHGIQRAVGVDISPTCVKDAWTNPQNTLVTEYRVGDAEDLPFDDNEFSIAVMSGLLEHVRNPEKALSEAKRVVCFGGIVLGNTPLGGYEYYPEQDAKERGDQEYLERANWRAHVRCWNPHTRLMFEPEVTIAFNDMTGDPNLPFACKGTRTGEWCFMFRNLKEVAQ